MHALMPRSSISRMVKKRMPSFLISSLSPGSMSRAPTCAHRRGSSLGAKPPMLVSSGVPYPSSVASGMPWMWRAGRRAGGVAEGIRFGGFHGGVRVEQDQPARLVFFFEGSEAAGEGADGD